MSIHTASAPTWMDRSPERVCRAYVPGPMALLSRRTVKEAMVAWPQRSTSSAGVK
ncbi:Uncharacterised protein [Flavonifractor plautii]|uniref:Uncharacterized protein n=1 Tax=Flavonifractor plautii TaxID=292800 RepID=A0A174NYJ7_FLAPL|nr:Uncharacterised protein [Flavonifractor plautii]